MEGLTVCTWHWGKKYPTHYVERLKAGVDRHLRQDYRFEIFSPEPQDEYLTKIPGCFARLRMFDPDWQRAHDLDGRIVCLDLDTVITGPLDPLFDRHEPFTILQGVNTSNPCSYNGSLWMLRTGYRPDVWSDFSLDAAAKAPYHSFPDDQGWFWHKIPNAAAFTSADGVYAFKKNGWPKGDALPSNARIVAFPGWRDPSLFTGLDWVGKHWAA